MSTEAIRTWAEDEGETGRTIWSWSFKLNGEDFGGYCASDAEAFSDAERHLELKIDDLSDEQAGECYRQLIGYDPMKEPDVGPSGVMTGDQTRELLFDRMKEMD